MKNKTIIFLEDNLENVYKTLSKKFFFNKTKRIIEWVYKKIHKFDYIKIKKKEVLSIHEHY